jgi:hypothetical protein
MGVATVALLKYQLARITKRNACSIIHLWSQLLLLLLLHVCALRPEHASKER